MAATPSIESLAQALGAKHHGNSRYSARCPAHEDRNPSLSISLNGEGKILFHCHAGCEQQAVIDALKARGLWDVNSKKVNRDPLVRMRVEWQVLNETGASGYLTRKQVPPLGVRFGRDRYGPFVAVPMRGPDGELRGLQYLYDGPVRKGRAKHFPFGSQKKGSYHLIGQVAPDQVLYLAEGYATAASISLATGCPVAVCFDAGNLEPCLAVFRTLYPRLPVVIAADNDSWKANDPDPKGRPLGNVGHCKALKAARAHGARVALPDFTGLECEDKPTDFNDLHLLAGLDEVKRQLEAAVEPKKAEEPAPTRPHWWEQMILTRDGDPRSVLLNAILPLGQDPAWAGVFAYNEFASRIELVARPPYAGLGPWETQELTDADILKTTVWLQERGVPVSKDHVLDAITNLAHEHCYHPVRNYLNGLTWDGAPRLDTWLIDHMGAEDTPLHRAYAAKWLIGAVARIYKPGCKVDTALITESGQGFGKSSTFAVLGGGWYTDEMPDLGNKDALMQLQGAWLVEFAELTSLNRQEAHRIKSFMSVGTDRYRPPYSKTPRDFPRQCVFVGTINPEGGYLKDPTGARRFWRVECGVGWAPGRRVDIEALAAIRDQLWAEAVVRFRAGERWWLDNQPLEQSQIEAAEGRYQGDAWEERVAAFCDSPRVGATPPTSVSIAEVLGLGLGLECSKWGKAEQTRVGQILTAMKWRHCQLTILGKRERRYLRPGVTWTQAKADIEDARVSLGSARPEQPSEGAEQEVVQAETGATTASARPTQPTRPNYLNAWGGKSGDTDGTVVHRDATKSHSRDLYGSGVQIDAGRAGSTDSRSYATRPYTEVVQEGGQAVEPDPRVGRKSGRRYNPPFTVPEWDQ
ncbi:MAG: toprim domain-containing protein [Pseudomonadota bacterium]|nr:toprim domain-containing protein [Pseudomonadota bacterium]